jgi:uncharacterized protein YkwD
VAGVGAAVLAMPGAPALADTCEGEHIDITALNYVEQERTILCLTNVARAEHGLAPLTMDSALRSAAHDHSADVGTYRLTDATQNRPEVYPGTPDPRHTPGNPHFNPFVPTKYAPDDRATLAGYPGQAGENVAWSNFPYWTGREMIEGWMNSPGHRANILEEGYVTAGMGLAIGSAGVVGTQNFGAVENGGTDTAVDLLRKPGCPAAESAVTAAETKVKKAKKKVKKADTKRERKRAKRKLRKAKAGLAEAQAAVQLQCHAESYAGATLSPLG